MKVSELIAQLSKYPPDSEIVMGVDFGSSTFHAVGEITEGYCYPAGRIYEFFTFPYDDDEGLKAVCLWPGELPVKEAVNG